MSHLLNPYPTDLAEPAKVVLSYYTGKNDDAGQPVNRSEVVHAAYQVLGVGLSMAMPDIPAQHQKGAKSKRGSGDEFVRPDGFKCDDEGCDDPCGPDCCTDEEKIAALKKVASVRSGADMKGIFDGPLLKALLAAASDIILKWLTGQLK